MSCNNCQGHISSLTGNSKLQVKSSVSHNAKAQTIHNSSISLRTNVGKALGLANMQGTSRLSGKILIDSNLQQSLKTVASITSACSLDIPLQSTNNPEIRSYNLKADKFSGPSIDFAPSEKLYPIEDISFVNKLTGDDITVFDDIDVYSYLDEGVFTGLYTQHNLLGELVSDDNNSIVFVSNVYNDGDLEYKFKVTTPLSVAKQSYFAIRVSAPFDSYKDRRPQQYKIHDIQLKDTDGNLIIKYEDIVVQGDTYFTTYISKPEINNLSLPTWNPNYPNMSVDGDYTITMSIHFDCIEYPFNEKFNSSFEETCVYSSSKLDVDDPLKDTVFKNLQISAFEIGNSGGLRIYEEGYTDLPSRLSDNYINLHMISEPSSKVSKRIVPSEILMYDSHNGIYPESDTVWENNNGLDNTTTDGCLSVLSSILSYSNSSYIELTSSSAHSDSGRLLLKFSNKSAISEYAKDTDGALNADFQKSFQKAKTISYHENDVYFDATSLKLEIVAKTSDVNKPYSIDVVGYSDDKLLCVTPAIGGFLQNDPSVSHTDQDIPDISGFLNTSLSISEESFSGDNDYYQKDITSFGDHYVITNLPLISTTEFATYTIPLEIRYDENKLGKQHFSLSSFLDSLYLDICPLPIGAIISSIRLVVEYNPSDALSMNVVGGPSNQLMGKKTFNLLPTQNISNTATALSTDYIPHGLTNPPDIKTNYSRRWRGVNDDVASGAFDVLEFANYDFEFHYPTHPFLNGYVDFSNTDEYDIKDENDNVIGTLDGPAGDAINDRLYQNIGWRLSSDQLFNLAPETDYKSIAWTSNIYDAFDRAIRLGDGDAYINLGQTPLSSDGWAIFLRFTPDNVDPIENRIILSRANGLSVGYNADGQLYASAGGNTINDGSVWTDYQYPLSILVTYNQNNDEALRLYTDNELVDDHQQLRDEYQFTFSDSLSQDLTIGSDLPIFVHEFGITNGSCNIIDGSIDRRRYQTSVEAFFRSHRMHFWQEGQTNYLSEQHTYIDDDVSKWHLGAFKICAFSPDFDFFTKRESTEYLQHKLVHDGSEYTGTIPDSLNLTGVSYHTQVENDFLRFNLSDMPSHDINDSIFYSTQPRISKHLPQGYTFNEEGICVDTILEYQSDQDVTWNDGSKGPKLIVSLYSATLNDDNHPSDDFGLVNRSIHHLTNSGCYEKYTSKFTFDSLFDNSEPWAMFHTNAYSREFKERIFSNNIDDMFLQYDLVYPTVNDSHRSYINIHSCNVRAEKALAYYSTKDTEFTLYCSGNTISYSYLSLALPYISTILDNDNLALYTSGDVFTVSNSLPLYLDSDFQDLFDFLEIPPSETPLFASTYGAGSESQSSLYPPVYYVRPKYTSLFVRGIGNEIDSINLFTSGNIFSDVMLGLVTTGGGEAISNFISFVNYNEPSETNQINNSLPLLFPFVFQINDPTVKKAMDLYVYGGDPIVVDMSQDIGLFVRGDVNLDNNQSGVLPLFVLNYASSEKWVDKENVIMWDVNNTGFNPDIEDQQYLSVDQDDEIRGVDITCYGQCNSYNVSACFEEPITIHDTTWYQSQCLNGGIFRAKSTYSNDEVYAWKHNGQYSDVTYNGHFYGVRKYVNLVPHGVYSIVIEGSTGSTRIIELPPQFVEVEYNKNEEDGPAMDYSGFKLVNDDVSDYDYVTNPVNEFGKSVASKENLLAIGAPGCTVDGLVEAGIVYLYRRLDRPTTLNWPADNTKSSWKLEEALSLPAGLRSDYSVALPEDNILIDEDLNLYLQKTRWFTGQDGRRFGHSVDIAINHDEKSLGEDTRQIAIVGGPSAKFTRTFYDEEPTVVNIGLFMFLGEFQQTTNLFRSGVRGVITLTYEEILRVIENKDLIFDYFGDPRIKFNIHIILYVAVADSVNKIDLSWPDRPQTDPLHIHVYPISRNNPEYTKVENDTRILNSIKAGFQEVFPTCNDIPPLAGYYVDSSDSFIGAISENVIESFKDFYNSDTYDSNPCIKDRFIQEYTTEDNVQRENWILLSTGIIDDLLNTKNLVDRSQIDLLGTSIRTPQPGETRTDYNIPPDSGGRAYIFEKESGYWNLIQEIRSPQIAYGYPDQFAHAVSISDNAEVIAIGSPYISQAVSILEYKPESKKQYYDNLYNWLMNSASRRITYQEDIKKYDKDLDIHRLYLALSQEDKFRSRLDLQINEYEIAHVMSYNDVQPIGSWDFIPNAVAPTSRLGYSVDVNEDGSKVVVGAPTDSMNTFNDADVYYAHNDQINIPDVDACDLETYSVSYNGELTGVTSSWAASVNAGAIYILESRRYYPHDTVMEYGRFGNLHRKLNKQTNDEGFDAISDIFYDKNYILTDQVTNDIPKNVGLLLIVTPEDDVLSDEVANNIIEWLALGDRNLVLVGNDPIWEDSGVYRKSNDVLNQLLRKLDSRMQIVSARNKKESLFNGYVDFNNILPSYVPYGTNETYVKRLQLRASGVGDIKMYYGDNSSFYAAPDCQEVGTCIDPGVKIQIHDKCPLPLMHNGDLRAEWPEHCCDNAAKDHIYYRNWALEFGSYVPQCVDDAFPVNPLANHEPIPLLTAAERITKNISVPEVPAKYGTRYLREDVLISETSYSFGSPIDNEIVIRWDNDTSPDFVNLNYTNQTNRNRFAQPANTGLLEATASSRIYDIESTKNITLDEYSRYAVSEEYLFLNDQGSYNKSEIVLIAGVNLETNNSLNGDIGVTENDKNIKFYTELVAGRKHLAQLSLWNNQTSPSSFKDAFNDSIIGDILRNYITVNQQVSSFNLNNSPYYNKDGTNRTFDTAWIANLGKYDQVSDSEINKIKSWLNRGNKKLIITFDYYAIEEDQKVALDKVSNLCQKLGVSIKPLSYNGIYKTNTGSASLDVIRQDGSKFNVSAPDISPFHSIANSEKAKTIAYQENPITHPVIELSQGNYWYMNAGIAKASFNVTPGSAYRLFITTDSYNDEITAPLTVNIGNANSIPSLEYPSLYSFSLFYLNPETYTLDPLLNDGFLDGDATSYQTYSRGTQVIDVQVGEGKQTLDIYLSSNIERVNATPGGSAPKTPRLIAISGIELNVNSVFSSTLIPDAGAITGVESYLLSEAIPGYNMTTTVVRPISSNNTVYCSDGCLNANLGGIDIEDGPMVAAQEINFSSPFDAGYKRSRITVLTDPSMIQGEYIRDNGIIPIDTFEFIRSLYPETNFEYLNNGRQFVSTTKIVSPERGSPTKYLSVNNSDYEGALTGLTSNFGSNTVISTGINHFKNESLFNPELVERPEVPWQHCENGEQITNMQNGLISGFYNLTDNFGSFCRFSGVINGVTHLDATIGGGMPSIMEAEGYDYLDLDRFEGGYPGDLFGYSVAIKQDKILVGSPFSAFNSGESIRPWDEDSELYLGEDGGPGAVYMFEKTGSGIGVSNTLVPWECTRKFRPDTLMGQLSGINTYSDQFGRSVAIRGDIIAIGAPNHDYGNYVIETYNDFVRKSFDSSFNITQRTIQDLGNSGIRDDLSILDNDFATNSGAIYMYENSIMNWENRSFQWNFIQKLVTNDSDSEKFGKTIYLGKADRSDSDYILSIGVDSINNGSYGTGISYCQDVMLRASRPALQNQEISIHAKILGNDAYYIYGPDEDQPVTLSFVNNGENEVLHYASGLVRATSSGEIFLEVSGQDPSIGGFIEHRPYIKALRGLYNNGVKIENNIGFIVEGKYPPISGGIGMNIEGV